jgi:hypothetical protein
VISLNVLAGLAGRIEWLQAAVKELLYVLIKIAKSDLHLGHGGPSGTTRDEPGRVQGVAASVSHLQRLH